MKNPFTKLLVPNYEENIEKLLKESLYDARVQMHRDIDSKQRADANLIYSTQRVETLTKALTTHKVPNSA